MSPTSGEPGGRQRVSEAVADEDQADRRVQRLELGGLERRERRQCSGVEHDHINMFARRDLRHARHLFSIVTIAAPRQQCGRDQAEPAIGPDQQHPRGVRAIRVHPFPRVRQGTIRFARCVPRRESRRQRRAGADRQITVGNDDLIAQLHLPTAISPAANSSTLAACRAITTRHGRTCSTVLITRRLASRNTTSTGSA